MKSAIPVSSNEGVRASVAVTGADVVLSVEWSVVDEGAGGPSELEGSWRFAVVEVGSLAVAVDGSDGVGFAVDVVVLSVASVLVVGGAVAGILSSVVPSRGTPAVVDEAWQTDRAETRIHGNALLA